MSFEIDAINAEHFVNCVAQFYIDNMQPRVQKALLELLIEKLKEMSTREGDGAWVKG